MPVIILYGIPLGLENSDPLKELILEKLPEAVASIDELGLAAHHVSVFAPKDMLAGSCGLALIAHIHDLHEKPERTPLVKQQLCDAVGEVLDDFANEHIPQCLRVEVSVRSVDTEHDGFFRVLIDEPS